MTLYQPRRTTCNFVVSSLEVTSILASRGIAGILTASEHHGLHIEDRQRLIDWRLPRMRG